MTLIFSLESLTAFLLTVKIKALAGGDLDACRKLPVYESDFCQMRMEKEYKNKVILICYCKVFHYTLFTGAN